MFRRTVLGLVGMAVLALVGLGGSATPAQEKVAKKEAPHEHGDTHKCAIACAQCMLACEACAHHCATLVIDGKKEHARTMGTCVDCGEYCGLAAKVVARQGPLAVTACEGCAKACDQCGTACEKHPEDEHMKACAKACRDCAKACRDMIEHAGHGAAGKGLEKRD
jgi:hypothetical protein